MNINIIWKNIEDFITPVEKDSHFNHVYKTNVKGVYKFEWYSPPNCECLECLDRGGGGVSIGFDSYDVYRKHRTKGYEHCVCFITKKEAEDYYNKAIKRPSKSTVSKPKKRPPIPLMANRDYKAKLIHDHIAKRGFNKTFDVAIVEKV